MFTCPHCRTTLSERKSLALGLIWTCPSCHGRATTIELLRKTIPKSLVDHLWQRARADQQHTGRRCLACERPMAEVPIIPGENKTICLEVCTICHFIWFDLHEFEALPKLTQKPSDAEGLSDEAKRALAMARLELLKQERLTPKMEVLGMASRWQITIEVLWSALQLLTG